MTSPSQIDIIATKILVQTQDAITALKNFDTSVQNSSTRVSAMAQQIRLLREETGKTAKQLADMFKQANAPSGGGRFGSLGMSNEQIDKARQMVETVDQYEKSQKRATDSVRKTGDESVNAANKTKSGWEKVTSSVNVLNIAFGILASTIIRNVFQAVTQFFSSAIKQATQFEETLYRLSNVEKQLSLEGVEISVQGLQQGILDLKKVFPIFSKEDIAQLVGSVATTTKELKLTENEILKLAAATAILNVNSTQTETVLQTQSRITNSLISPQAKSIGDLALSFGKPKIEAKAFEMQILKVGESFADLTEAEKTKVKLQIVFDTAGLGNIDDIKNLRDEIQKAGGDFSAFNEYLDSNSAKLMDNKAALDDLKVAFGQFILPFIPALTDFFKIITGGLTMAKVAFIEFYTVLGAGKAVINAFYSGNIKSMEDLTTAWTIGINSMRDQLVNTFFKEMPSDAPDWFKKLYGNIINQAKDTPTGDPPPPLNPETIKKAEENAKKIQDVYKENGEKLADIEKDYGRKIEDINRDYAQKLDDIARDSAQKREDAALDYSIKVEDINRDANQKIAEAQEDARKKEIDREAEFQRKLRELREKFLFDLEDALRERDARQVLRLMRQYQMDKKNLEERRKLDAQESKKDLAQKLQDIEIERQQKLAEAKRDYDLKLAEIKRGEAQARAEANRWRQRALEDARIWYQRQLADQREYLKRKLADLQAELAAELKAQQSYQNAVSGINQPISASNLPAGYTVSGVGGSISGPGNFPVFTVPGGMGYAEGGTLIAKKPTVAMFGEAGAEAVKFTPLNKTGKDINKVFGDVNGLNGGGSGGYLNLRVSISDGLIADIVDTSLNNVAAHIEHTRRVA